jgi:hypothetical protein
MRLEAIHRGVYGTSNAPIEAWEVLGDYGSSRNRRYPELADLLLAKEANALFNAPLLSRDELEFANFIINKLDIDPHYVPSMTLLTAIRSVNAKLAMSGYLTPDSVATGDTPVL